MNREPLKLRKYDNIEPDEVRELTEGWNRMMADGVPEQAVWEWHPEHIDKFRAAEKRIDSGEDSHEFEFE